MESKTRIIATLGPASEKDSIINDLIKHKVNMFRLNFSWGTHDWHKENIKNIRKISANYNTQIDIMQDLSGPRVQEESGHRFDREKCGGIITEKDKDDLSFGIKEGIDYVAMSFVGCAQDVTELKNLILDLGGNQKVLSKIERIEAINNIDEIIDVSDGIIIARGDLGNEIPIEEIPFVQHKIINKCNRAGKMVIVATQMLYSMVENNIPTRAEVSDVAYAIIDGADGILLSDETARGKYPVESIEILERIATNAEKHSDITLIG